MNFKRFHESKNLCSSTPYKIGYSVNVSGEENQNAEFNIYSAKVTGNSQYSFSFTYPPNAASRTVRVHEYILGVWQQQILSASCAQFPQNFTTSAGVDEIRISIVNTTSNLMLNTGSQPLPYEPYGNTWINTPHYIMGTSTDTLTTLPAVLYPNAVTATVGLKGNMVQNGTPTPDNPIMPQGTEERTGNLAYGMIRDANISPTGKIDRASNYDLAIARVEAGKVYTANTYVFAFYTDEPIIGSVSYDGIRNVVTQGSPTTFTAPITGYVAFRVDSGEQAMLNTGSTALPYEPYGVKIPILNNSQTTNVYLGEVETTRKIKKLVLTGEENWQLHSSQANLFTLSTIVDYLYNSSLSSICSHYTTKVVASAASAAADNNTLSFYFNSNSPSVRVIYIKDMTYSTAADFKAYLQQQYAAGTPVTVWYVLSEPQTTVVNEPLRKIGDYADTVSGITIPTIAGANTIDVDTTLKPSEVTVNYKGWHPVSAVHERESGQWD